MTDMVEKVGRSMAEVGEVMYERCPDYWNECARAAIRALMEPTEEMYDAAWREIQTNPEHNALKQRVSVHGIRTLINALHPAILKAALDD